MSYVFDTSPLSALFKNYYPDTFPTLWENFDNLVNDGRLTSTRENLREVMDGAPDECIEWAKRNQKLFVTPVAAEGAFVAEIYKVAHFQQNIEQQKLLRGGRNADPFVIARAAVNGLAVVTMELIKPHAVKIPNICQHFGVKCLSLGEFMREEGWKF